MVFSRFLLFKKCRVCQFVPSFTHLQTVRQHRSKIQQCIYLDVKFCLLDVPEQGEVMLNRSNYNYYYNYGGLLQVWLNGRWGVVSDMMWTIKDTNAVCRQLGRNGKDCIDMNYGVKCNYL